MKGILNLVNIFLHHIWLNAIYKCWLELNKKRFLPPLQLFYVGACPNKCQQRWYNSTQLHIFSGRDHIKSYEWPHPLHKDENWVFLFMLFFSFQHRWHQGIFGFLTFSKRLLCDWDENELCLTLLLRSITSSSMEMSLCMSCISPSSQLLLLSLQLKNPVASRP